MSFKPIDYNICFEPLLINFLKKCLPESGRILEIEGRHKFYKDITNYFDKFWCIFDKEEIIGTVAIRKLFKTSCELKSLYLLEKYHGKGYGRLLLETAINYAQKRGYDKMYLDSISTTSKNAIRLYRKAGFINTQKYNDNIYSDVYMVLELNK